MSVPIEGLDASEFGERLSAAVGNQVAKVVAARAQISSSAMSDYLAGKRFPKLDDAARLAKVLGVSLVWLATGEGAPNAAAGGYVSIPVFDVRLAAGASSFAEGAVQLGDMPMDLDLLRSLGRTAPDDLAALEASGDSMEPLIQDGARVVVDLKDTRLREGIFAFRYDDDLRIKRLRRLMDGIEVISENPAYSPELIGPDDMNRFAIIGRARYAGRFL